MLTRYQTQHGAYRSYPSCLRDYFRRQWVQLRRNEHVRSIQKIYATKREHEELFSDLGGIFTLLEPVCITIHIKDSMFHIPLKEVLKHQSTVYHLAPSDTSNSAQATPRHDDAGTNLPSTRATRAISDSCHALTDSDYDYGPPSTRTGKSMSTTIGLLYCFLPLP